MSIDGVASKLPFFIIFAPYAKRLDIKVHLEKELRERESERQAKMSKKKGRVSHISAVF